MNRVRTLGVLLALAALLAPPARVVAQSDEPDPLIAETLEQFATIDGLRAEYRELGERAVALEGEEHDVVALQMRQRYLEFTREVDGLVGNIVELEEKQVRAPDLRRRAVELLSRDSKGFPTFVDGVDERAVELRALREQAPPEAVADLEDRIDGHEQVTDQVYGHFAAHLGHLDEAGDALDKALELRPELDEEWVAVALSSADARMRERYLEGLRVAGLKD